MWPKPTLECQVFEEMLWQEEHSCPCGDQNALRRYWMFWLEAFHSEPAVCFSGHTGASQNLEDVKLTK